MGGRAVGACQAGAGVAAAVAVQQQRGFAELDIGQVQTELKRQDVRLH